MRKKSSTKVYRDFEVDVQAALDLLTRSLAAFPGAGDRSRLSAMVFQQIYVAFERFVSDLLVAYVNSSPSNFTAEMRRRIRESVKNKYGAWLSDTIDVRFAQHLSVDDVERALDPDGRSITFASTESLVTFAGTNLSTHHARRFGALSTEDRALIDAARAIRHQISHRSESSRAAMNDAIGLLAGPGNAGLTRAANEVQHVGAYLRSSHGGATRVHTFGRRLISIAHALSR